MGKTERDRLRDVAGWMQLGAGVAFFLGVLGAAVTYSDDTASAVALLIVGVVVAILLAGFSAVIRALLDRSP